MYLKDKISRKKGKLLELTGALIQEGLMLFFVEFLIVETRQFSCIKDSPSSLRNDSLLDRISFNLFL